MPDFQLEEQKEIEKDIDNRYRDYVDDLLLFRFQLIFAIGIVLELAFSVIDRIAYPAYASTFLEIRLITGLAMLLLIFISFSKRITPQIVWVTDIGGSLLIICACIMTFITDGSSSRYYEGANLVFLGMSIVNPFHIRHLICCLLIWIGFFEIAMLGGHSKFNMLNFTFANYFMSSTALLVAILTKFYKDQHYKAYVRQEQLKLKEEALAKLYSQADKLSKTDELTKTHNRRSFFEMLENKIASSERSNTSFYLVIFDVDHFKELNDRWGHPFGDLALTKVTEVVKDNIRTNDCLGRFGGDEFVLFLDITDVDMLMPRLTRISRGVTSLNLKQNNQSVLVSVSIGAAKFIPGKKMTQEQLLEKADQQLYTVKKTNRGQIGIEE